MSRYLKLVEGRRSVQSSRASRQRVPGDSNVTCVTQVPCGSRFSEVCTTLIRGYRSLAISCGTAGRLSPRLSLEWKAVTQWITDTLGPCCMSRVECDEFSPASTLDALSLSAKLLSSLCSPRHFSGCVPSMFSVRGYLLQAGNPTLPHI